MIFSHDKMRPLQEKFVDLIENILSIKKNVLIHAPTGLGKTAAALSPALDYAIKNDLFVFFVTSRHTQHKIVIDTLKKIQERHNLKITCSSIIGKKWMCSQDNVNTMLAGDFSEYCKSLVKNNSCHFFQNTKAKNNIKAKHLIESINSPLTSEEVIAESQLSELCPYEIALMLSEKAKVVISDYNYLFNPHIRIPFLKKTKKDLEKAIVIVDEAHNLPSRVRELLTARLTDRVVRLAFKEAEKFHIKEVLPVFTELSHIMRDICKPNSERLVNKDELIKPLSRIDSIENIVDELRVSSETVLVKQKRSFIGLVANFLEKWCDSGDGFARMVKKDDKVTLSSVCLDPSLLTSDVFNQAHSSILMSGTLSPIKMFKDVLGVNNSDSEVFPSPFPDRNRLCLIVPRTTTRFAKRSEQQFENIGSIAADLANQIGGCVMLFFPSYFVRDKVYDVFQKKYSKTVFVESQGMSKENKDNLLKRFQNYKESGAALLAVAAGSFGEGVDLPGVLKGVIVVGLPLDKPSLETKELISYYDKKFGKGWDYGYTLPAMTKCIQNAGRCIRSENDKGVLVFLDERYAWANYQNTFPREWNLKTTMLYEKEIKNFRSL